MADYFNYPKFINEWELEFLNLLMDVGLANTWRKRSLDLQNMKPDIYNWMQKNQYNKGELFFERLNACSEQDQKSLIDFIADIIERCGGRAPSAKTMLRERIQDAKTVPLIKPISGK